MMIKMMVMMIPNDNDAGMSEPQLKTICESSQLHSLWGTIIRSLFEAHPGHTVGRQNAKILLVVAWHQSFTNCC